MSDFDKEKEREKLRRKFERDEERRRSTEQMSELLLKGATMLNVHCQECASPIFRHEGNEFCPTCGRSVDELQTAGDPSNLTSQPATDGEAPPASEAPSEPTEQPPAAPSQPPESVAEEPEPADTPPAAASHQPQYTPDPGDIDGSVTGTAGEALGTTIAALAERAATAEDPHRAREYLDAAHQAAETLTLLAGRST